MYVHTYIIYTTSEHTEKEKVQPQSDDTTRTSEVALRDSVIRDVLQYRRVEKKRKNEKRRV